MKRRTFVSGLAVAGAAGALGAMRPRGAPAIARGRMVTRLDTGWKFLRDDPPGVAAPGFNDAGWESATLPHTARVEALVTGLAGSADAQWQGTCWYRRTLRLPPDAAGDVVLLRFEAAMNVAEIWLDGERIGGHQGGFLPFVLDLTDRLRPGHHHVLAVRLDNRDNPVTGPKPLAQLDFNTWHGLYRPAFLVRKERLHFTDPLLADRPASGGIFVSYPQVSPDVATVRVQAQVRNAHASTRAAAVRLVLRTADGETVATATSRPVSLPPGADAEVVQELAVTRPRLWSPASPFLYRLECAVLADDTVVDADDLRVGIRHLTVARDGFRINGERLYLRGANRHQEYPYIGYALPEAAQYRDARKIKEAGFDYVRLSHYPQSPAFLDACDELGLVVMSCIPGWQYFNPDPAFAELQYRNCRDLIRRDRNHPCVVLWEVSLNETAMPPEFIARTHAIAHEEYPGDQCLTAGWVPGYDVLLDARQHGGCRAAEGVCLVSEYGDWEYYAMNAGLDQTAWRDLSPAQSNSRQLRWQGERALLQQALNFQEAHNDNQGTGAIGDGLWVMFDYNRGYAPDIESSGCMDIFRLPKYGMHFFRSQRGPADPAGGPMVFIASEWAPRSSAEVRVFSNCEEVALSLDGALVARQSPDQGPLSARLAHPPFTFRTGGFRPGLLEAVGYIGGRPAARHAVRTPGRVEQLTLAFDLSGRPRDRDRKDDLFCYAALRDAHGTVVPDAWENVAFGAVGGARLVGANPASSEAGIATILVETEPGAGPAAVYALAAAREGNQARLLSAGLALEGTAPSHRAQLAGRGAVLRVEGQVVASLVLGAPKYRIPASAPPHRRDPFRR
jgi:beta-galactosidase